jgi:hypothetical protein
MATNSQSDCNNAALYDVTSGAATGEFAPLVEVACFEQGGQQQDDGVQQRPQVTLSFAQSLDGSITAERGRQVAISSPESFRMTHSLRARHDAIAVGVGTLLSDNPSLNTRLVQGAHACLCVFRICVCAHPPFNVTFAVIHIHVTLSNFE